MKKIKTRIAAAIGLATLLVSCKTTTPQEWTYSEKSDPVGLITGTLKPNAKSKTSITGVITTNANGTRRMDVERIFWFNNWNDGWTEAEVFSTGSLIIAPVPDTNAIEVTSLEGPVLEYTEKAAIRYRDKIIEGVDGAALFERRLGRVRAAAAWLKTALGGAQYNTEQEFALVARKHLFPEIYGYSEGKPEMSKDEAKMQYGEGINWDTAYTEARLDPILAEIRNSGTLYRDWEESSPLFYFIYNWEK